MAFTPRFTDAGMLGNPLWYSAKNRFYPQGNGLPNCTCYVEGRIAEITGKFYGFHGNGGDWYNNCSQFRRSPGVNAEPELGAIGCWAGGGYGGHVAVVEKINRDANGEVVSVGFSNSGWSKIRDGRTAFTYREWTKASGYQTGYHGGAYHFVGFIYVLQDPPAEGTYFAWANPYVAAAIAGCFCRESAVNPGAWESYIESTFDHQYVPGTGVGGYGLGQWTNVGTSHGRCWNLKQFADRNEFEVSDGYTQLGFILEENWWNNHRTKRGDYTTLMEYLESPSTNLADLTWDWLACWEGVPGNAYAQRLNWAEIFYDYILEHQYDDRSQYLWVSGNRRLNWNETLNNVMCLWFWIFDMSGALRPLQTRKHFKPWMMTRSYRILK